MYVEDATDSEMSGLVQEMQVMKIIGQHRNVLSLLGCCTQAGQFMILSIYIFIDLFIYLFIYFTCIQYIRTNTITSISRLH